MCEYVKLKGEGVLFLIFSNYLGKQIKSISSECR